METFNTIHKYLIVIAILAAYIHFIIVFIKAYKKIPLMEDLTMKEFKRVAKERAENEVATSGVFLKPFLIFMFWTGCICGYFVLMLKLGWIW